MSLAPIDLQGISREPLHVTDTELGGAGTTESVLTDAAHALRVLGVVTADVAGTLTLRHGADGTGAFQYEVSYAVGPGEKVVIDEPVWLRYIQTRYVNGGSAQGSFDLALFLVPA